MTFIFCPDLTFLETIALLGLFVGLHQISIYIASVTKWYGPRQANLVLIAYASSEGSGEPAHPRSLARTFAARSYKQWIKKNLQTENQIRGPSEWLGMRGWNLSWRNARRHKFAWRGSYNVKTILSGRHSHWWLKETLNDQLLKTIVFIYINWAPSSEFVSSSIPSWHILTAHAQPFRGARDLAFCLKVPLDSLLVWASSGGSGETARMRRLAWTFAARICDKYQIRLTRPIYINWKRIDETFCSLSVLFFLRNCYRRKYAQCKFKPCTILNCRYLVSNVS